ncbi:SDR family oxidoreductase [Pseudoteredinibacter isoporae]|uniref:Citronellol/citronellal dehydrogenase n=1 Tax=Pseudoteredinibacter isoporae TaxID=570281 RepID=A0A7X0MVG4_9GAMM|nr:NAD(P)-dependent oxidoreductase [Pseudoteredinibacter isoporae]MBB6521358.1 citronellol/citronellal dehydrogenase [Pseudoteredinibacter isoporae]NHO86913.1 NAD(P)-dependent oxidoreductase [Pseudoteredinibacter isoporae]NIB24635.1 NAD(P)-dependent oxidoreductase [Pseudoteredinibacter isoporae]
MSNLKGKTLFITGASRGIGREIALRAAKDGANIVIAAKSDAPHPKLPGTIHTVAEEVRAAGGQALALKVDVRDEALINEAMDKAVAEFGGIDALINNASAINLTNVQATEAKRFDLMHSINTRGTLLCSKAAIPHLKKSDNGHIITLSPPLNLNKHWLGGHIPYTVTKYSMSLLTLGLAEELRNDGVAANCLWPKTTIATAAVEFAIDDSLLAKSRTPEIMADAAYEILISNSQELSGETIIDEDILRERGHSDFSKYLNDPECTDLFMDLFVD